MEIEKLTEIELLNKDTIFKMLDMAKTDPDIENKYRLKAKELRVVGAFERAVKTFKKMRVNSKKEEANFCNFGEEYEEICTGEWVTSKEGIFRQEADYETGDIKLIEASRMQIVPVETYKNMDTGTEKVKLKYKRFKKWKDLICEKVTISNLNKIIELSNKGIDVNSLNARDLISYLYDCLTLNDETVIPHYDSISRFGWVGDKFLPYDATLKFDGENEYKHLYESVHSTGDLDQWIDVIGKLRRKSVPFRLLLASSFASVMIDKINALPFVFHLWGGTGAGKTVALMCAMSIWGNPKGGKLTRTMNMTQNSMMNTASFLHNIPFAGDELQTIKSRYDNYDQLIMKITEGVERGRMTFNTLNETKTWACSFLFTGEEPCTKAESGGGTRNRVIEIECLEPLLENGNKVVNFINNNYGLAGEPFIEYVKKQNLCKDNSKIFNEILDKSHTTEKQAQSMSMILQADRYIDDLFFKTESLQVEEVKKYLADVKDIDITVRSYDWLLGFINTNVNRFREEGNQGEIWGKIDTDNDYVLINKNVLLKNMASNGFEFDAMKSKWTSTGKIIKNTQGKISHQTKVFGIKSNYIKLKIDSFEEITEKEEDLLPF